MHSEVCIPYVLSRHPATVSPDSFLARVQEGANCQLYVAGVIRALGFYMPDYYRSSEIYEDPAGVLLPVTLYHELPQTGDIIGFWPKGENSNAKRIHVGIIHMTEDGVTVLHASRQQGKVVQSPLVDLLQHYYRIACIKRPWMHITTPNETAMRRLGLTAVQVVR